MGIEFHCSHCNQMIRASSEHAGKRGKCPHCKNSVYIPTPSEEIEPLAFAPVDAAEEQRRRQLAEESRRLAESLRSDRSEIPEERASSAAAGEPRGDVRLQVDMDTLVVEYVSAMAAGQLDEAEEYAEDIRAHRAQADSVITQMMQDEIPPKKLAGIPRPVLLKFLKQLLE